MRAQLLCVALVVVWAVAHASKTSIAASPQDNMRPLSAEMHQATANVNDQLKDQLKNASERAVKAETTADAAETKKVAAQAQIKTLEEQNKVLTKRANKAEAAKSDLEARVADLSKVSKRLSDVSDLAIGRAIETGAGRFPTQHRSSRQLASVQDAMQDLPDLGETIQFGASFSVLRFSPTKLRSSSSTTYVQIADIKFQSSGQFPVSLSDCSASTPGGDSPSNEGPEKAIDDSTSTKWLDKKRTPLLITCSPPVSVDAFTWVTGNDASERDPVQWTLEGAASASGPWMTLAQQTSDYSVTNSRKTQLPWFPLDRSSAAAPTEATQASSNVFETNVGTGGWGGSCTCPDGQVYQVGDNSDSCGSLACLGGTPGTCTRSGGAWSGNKVTCGAGGTTSDAETSEEESVVEEVADEVAPVTDLVVAAMAQPALEPYNHDDEGAECDAIRAAGSAAMSVASSSNDVIQLKPTMEAGNMEIEHRPESCQKPPGPSDAWEDAACRSVSSVQYDAITPWVRAEKYAGVQGKVLLDRVKESTRIHGRFKIRAKTWHWIINCQCNAYVQVGGYKLFTASSINVEIQGRHICGSSASDSCKGTYTRVVLYSRADTTSEWTQYPKDFYFSDSGKFTMPLDDKLTALELRIMFVCTVSADADGQVGCFNGLGNGKGTDGQEACKGDDQGHQCNMTSHGDYREIGVQVLTDSTDFGWDKELQCVAANLLPEDGVAAVSSLDCAAVNADPVLDRQFSQWLTPGDGTFKQDPHETASPISLIRGEQSWEVFVSKRQGTYGVGISHEPEYDVEKRMFCAKKVNGGGGLRELGSPLSTSGAQTEKEMVCCVRKQINFLNDAEKAKAKTTPGALATAEARLRNF